MNLFSAPTTPRYLALVLTLWLALPSAVEARSSDDRAAAPAASLTLAASQTVPPAAFWDNIAGNRSRMIQVGLVAVCLGFFLLSWSRK